MQLGLSRRDVHDFYRVMTMSVGDLLDDWFEHDAFKGAMASTGVVGVWAGPRTPGTAYNLLHHELGEIEGVPGLWGHVKGGMGAISMAIARSAEAAGAVVRVGADVRSIDVRDGRVTGVTLAGGEELRAPVVLSGAHPKTTVLELAGAEHFPDEVVSDLRRYKTRGGSVKVNWVLSEAPRYEGVSEADQERLVRSGVAFCPSIDQLERAWQDACRGVPSEVPYLEVEVPSTIDSTLTDDGSVVMTMFTQYGPVGRGRLARRRARGLRRPLPRHPGRAGAERARRRDPPRGARAARPRAYLRPRRRLDLPGRAGARPDGLHAPDAGAGAVRDPGRRPVPLRRRDPPGRRGDGARRAQRRAAGAARPALASRAPARAGGAAGVTRGPRPRARVHNVSWPAPAGSSRRCSSRWRRRPSARAGRLPSDDVARIRSAALEAGLAGGLHAVEHGGQGWSKLEWVLVEEQFGRSTNALSWHVPSAYNVLASGSDPQIDRYLKPALRGSCTMPTRSLRPARGQTPPASPTTAVRPDGGWVIDGEKWFVTYGDVAAVYIVMALAEGRPTLFLVDRACDGIEIVDDPPFTHSYPHGHPTIRFSGVRVGDDAVVGGVGEGEALQRAWFTEERLGIAARGVGAMWRLLEEATAWALEREQGGVRIMDHQGVSFPLADSAADAAAGRALTLEVARLADQGSDPKLVHAKASMAKLFVSEAAYRCADRAVQVFGGRGYMRTNVAERFLRELRVDRIWEGTSEIQRLIVARALERRGVERTLH